MNGKEKCRILKEIRRQIALDNNITLITSECKHQGECKGTCPKCESEVRYLERELERKERRGMGITLAGLALASTLGLASCGEPMEGDVEPTPSYYDSSLSGKENSKREEICNHITDYLQRHYQWNADENHSDGNWIIKVSISPDAKVTNVQCDAKIPEDLINFIQNIPEEQLSGLTQECTFNIYAKAGNGSIIFFNR